MYEPQEQPLFGIVTEELDDNCVDLFLRMASITGLIVAYGFILCIFSMEIDQSKMGKRRSNLISHRETRRKYKALQQENLTALGNRISYPSKGIGHEKLSTALPNSGLVWYSVLALRRMPSKTSQNYRRKRNENGRPLVSPRSFPTTVSLQDFRALIRKVKPLLKNRKFAAIASPSNSQPFRDNGRCYPLARQLARQALVFYSSGNMSAYDLHDRERIRPILMGRGDRSMKKRLIRLIMMIRDGSINAPEQINGCPLPGNFHLGRRAKGARPTTSGRATPATARRLAAPTVSPPPRSRPRTSDTTHRSRLHRFGHPIYHNSYGRRPLPTRQGLW